MKRTLLMAAALVVLAGCGEKKAAGGATDTAGMATPADTGMAGMSKDSAAAPAAAPMSDSTMARDTTKKKK
jgi:hypothetical protein